MQSFYNSNSAELADGDFTCNYVGYWTDNGKSRCWPYFDAFHIVLDNAFTVWYCFPGAYYYYNTEKGCTYEKTILDIKKHSIQYDLPYR